MNEPFDKKYWDTNYQHPETMDGIGNVKDHSRYLKSYFNLEGVDIDSIIDYGAGFGHLIGEMVKTFGPMRALALEPSSFAFKKLEKRVQRFHHPQFKAELLSIQDWFKKANYKKTQFDLGLCNSVMQYLSNEDLQKVIPLMAKQVKYLYLTVPTDKEYQRQIDDLEYHDTYAIHRSRDFYIKLIKPHFTIISSRVLESKHYYDEMSSPFTDLLYRH